MYCPSCGRYLEVSAPACPHCAKVLPAGFWEGFTPIVGQVLENRYRIDSFLARGGMGEVFRGTDLALRRKVAVKFLADDLRREPSLVKRFLREARAMEKLEHENVVPVYAAGEAFNRPYIVMRYLAGQTVADMIDGGGRLPVASSVAILAQVCDGLEHVHRKGFVHRDLKPQNLLVEGNGRCVILDFGILRLADSTLTTAGAAVGTPAYVAPEQVRDPKAADARSDLYAVGITFFEMVTGQLPFQSESSFEVLLKQCNEPPPRATSIVSELPPAVDRVIFKMLAKDPSRRYQTAAEAKEALLALVAPPAETPAPSSRTPGPPGQPSRRPGAVVEAGSGPSPRRRSSRTATVLVLAGLAGTLAAIAVIAWYVTRERPKVRLDDSGPVPEAMEADGAVPGEAPVEEQAPARTAPAPPPTGKLVVTTHPPDALVALDGRALGGAPRELALAPGEYEVEASRRGYRERRRKVRLAAGMAAHVHVALEPLPATLRVVTRGGSAVISIDSEVLGKTQAVSSRLPPGTHVVRARLGDGRGEVVRRVVLAPGEDQTLEIDLSSPDLPGEPRVRHGPTGSR